MKVLIIDSDQARTAPVTDGLSDIRTLDLHLAPALEEAPLAQLKPDCVILIRESADSKMLDSLQQAMRRAPSPVIMFVDRSQPGLAEQAVRAGVAAYVVDGLRPARVAPIVEVAMMRFRQMQQLQDDLARVLSDLAPCEAARRPKTTQ